jgi:hypothetical protein
MTIHHQVSAAFGTLTTFKEKLHEKESITHSDKINV